MSNCSGCNKRIYSNSIINSNGDCSCGCSDACVTPSCGDPAFLSVLTPVIYDEIGVNVCRTISIADLITANPTTTHVSAEILSIAPSTTAPITITPIVNRPNCYEVTLTNLTITFVVRLYDCCNRLLATSTVTGLYFPPATDAGFDTDTNPTEVSLEIFAPYGVAYADATALTPALNTVAFLTGSNSYVQGLNLSGIPKVLSLDVGASTITIGITLVLSSIYFIAYQIPHNGKSPVSKGNLSSSEDSVCMNFVSGCLLDRNIKPLEFGNPFDNKIPCSDDIDLDPCNDCVDS